MQTNDIVQMTAPVRRWLVIGDVGSEQNFHVGDEAMFEANVRLLRQICPQAQVSAVSKDPAFTHATYGVPSYPSLGFESCVDEAECEERLQRLSRNHWISSTPAAFDALIDSGDGLIISGGGNLRSTWPSYIYERLALVRRARSNGAPVILLGQTLGPELSERHRAMLSEILSAASWIGVRELASYQLALDLGASADRLSYQVDDADALSLDACDAPFPSLPLADGVPWMGVTFHPLCDPFGNDPLLDRLAHQLEQAAQYTGCTLVFIPHARAHAALGSLWSDEDMGRALATRMQSATMHVLPVLTPTQVAHLTSQASWVISSRYHPLVFALAATKPCFGVWCDEYTRIKLQGALHHYGCAQASSSLEDVLSGSWVKNLPWLWNCRHQLQAHMATHGNAIRADEVVRREALARLMTIGGPVAIPLPARWERWLPSIPTVPASPVDTAPSGCPQLPTTQRIRSSVMVTEAAWQQFAVDGFMHLGPVLSPEAVEALKARADALALGDIYNPAVQMQLDTGGDYEALPDAVERFEEGTLRYRKIQGLEHDGLFAQLISQPLFREICAKMYGSHAAVSLFRAMIMNKPAHHGTSLPWHQDGGTVWQLDRDPLVTIWVALDDANSTNGCMEAIKGSHRLGLLSTDGSTLSDADVEQHCEAAATVALEVPAGHAVLLHNWLIHRSGLNPSPTPRRAFTMCCMDGRTRNLLTGQHFPLIFGEQSSESDVYVRQMQSDLAAQTDRFNEAERYARDLLENNNRRQEMLSEATLYARSLERELRNLQQTGGMPEDDRRLTAAVAQMREEILDLNRALQSAYEQLTTGVDSEVQDLKMQVFHLTAAIDALHKSASWRITEPLRLLSELLTKRPGP